MSVEDHTPEPDCSMGPLRSSMTWPIALCLGLRSMIYYTKIARLRRIAFMAS